MTIDYGYDDRNIYNEKVKHEKAQINICEKNEAKSMAKKNLLE